MRRLTILGRMFLAGGLLLLASLPCLGSESVILSVPAGECTLSLGAVDNWPSLRLRAAHPGHRPCFIGKADAVSLLERAFGDAHPALNGRVFTSLAMGRLIDYPWLAQFLALRAARDPGWDVGAGKPAQVDINRYVAELLFSPEVVRELEAPLRAKGYRITGVTVEKVLVGGFENVPQIEGPHRTGKIPFDAQVWFRLERD
ncbi:MAG: hypothetical protein R6V84_04870 [Desulfobacterales bacterium]